MSTSAARKKILIVKLGAIGDVVMALYVVSAVRAREPGSHITWVCGKTTAPLLRLVTGIDRIIVLDDRKLLTGSFPEKAEQIMQAWLNLAFARYDLILIPYRDRRYRILTAFTHRAEFRSFSGGAREASIIPGRYHGAEYRRLYDGADSPPFHDTRLPEIGIPQNEAIDRLLPSEKKICLLMPGGTNNILRSDMLRRWPIEKYAEIARELNQKGFAVALGGLENDKPLLQQFEGIEVLDFIGKTSLHGLLYLLSKSRLLITHDTGTLHLAKLTRTPAIGLFGPVAPFERIGPGENILPVWNADCLPCAPCYDGRTFADCSDNLCMQGISAESVLREAEKLLNDA